MDKVPCNGSPHRGVRQIIGIKPPRLGNLCEIGRNLPRSPVGIERNHVLIGIRPALASGIDDILDRNPDFLADFAGDALLERLSVLEETRYTGKDVLVSRRMPGKEDLSFLSDQYDDRRRNPGVEKMIAGRAPAREFRMMILELMAASTAKPRGVVPVQEAQRAAGGCGKRRKNRILRPGKGTKPDPGTLKAVNRRRMRP